MDGQYNRLVWCINTRTILRCFGETKMASNNENGIGHLRALVPWLMMMMMMMILECTTLNKHSYASVAIIAPLGAQVCRKYLRLNLSSNCSIRPYSSALVWPQPRRRACTRYALSVNFTTIIAARSAIE